MKSDRFTTIGSMLSSIQTPNGASSVPSKQPTENEVLQRKLKTISRDIRFLVGNDPVAKKLILKRQLEREKEASLDRRNGSNTQMPYSSNHVMTNISIV